MLHCKYIKCLTVIQLHFTLFQWLLIQILTFPKRITKQIAAPNLIAAITSVHLVWLLSAWVQYVLWLYFWFLITAQRASEVPCKVILQYCVYFPKCSFSRCILNSTVYICSVQQQPYVFLVVWWRQKYYSHCFHTGD